MINFLLQEQQSRAGGQCDAFDDLRGRRQKVNVQSKTCSPHTVLEDVAQRLSDISWDVQMPVYTLPLGVPREALVTLYSTVVPVQERHLV